MKGHVINDELLVFVLLNMSYAQFVYIRHSFVPFVAILLVVFSSFWFYLHTVILNFWKKQVNLGYKMLSLPGCYLTLWFYYEHAPTTHADFCKGVLPGSPTPHGTPCEEQWFALARPPLVVFLTVFTHLALDSKCLYSTACLSEPAGG